MTRASRIRLDLAACLVPLLVALPAIAQDDEEAAFDRTPQDCIVTTSIDQTDVIDDQNIIFYMNGRRVYRNHLPRRCPGLARENRFSYEVRSARLCSIDTITVLEQFGVGLRPGFTCRLGEFVPLSPEEIEDLDLREEEGRGGRAAQSTIETRSVEVGRAAESADEETAPEEAGQAGEAAESPDGAAEE